MAATDGAVMDPMKYKTVLCTYFQQGFAVVSFFSRFRIIFESVSTGFGQALVLEVVRWALRFSGKTWAICRGRKHKGKSCICKACS